MSTNPKAVPAVLLKNAGLAPVIFFDGVPAYGLLNGVVELELAVRMLAPKSDGNVAVDMTCVAHLRCSLAAAVNLRDAVDKAIEMAKGPTKPN